VVSDEGLDLDCVLLWTVECEAGGVVGGEWGVGAGVLLGLGVGEVGWLPPFRVSFLSFFVDRPGGFLPWFFLCRPLASHINIVGAIMETAGCLPRGSGGGGPQDEGRGGRRRVSLSPGQHTRSPQWT
jgi:hypothetical protein